MKRSALDHSKMLVLVFFLASCFIVILIVVNVILWISKGQSYGELHDAVENCLKLGDGSEAVTCLNDLSFAYYDKDDCRRALDVYDDVPEDRFDKGVLVILYNNAYSTSLSCDESLQDYWSKKFYDLANQLEARG